MLGHRIVGTSLLYAGDLTQARIHLDRAIALYNPVAHRPLATRFGQDVRMSSLMARSLTLWSLGYPDAAQADSEQSLRDAREIGHAATLFLALFGRWWTHTLCGNYLEATALADELVAFADEKGAAFWKMVGTLGKGWICALTGKASIAIQIMLPEISAQRSVGHKLHVTAGGPLSLSMLANAYAQVGLFEDASRCIEEAIAVMKTTEERFCDPQVYQSAGEIALMYPESDAQKAEAYFERALAVAGEQQAKSLELRAAMRMARLWRDQGKRQQAQDLLAPVYGWFTEGFDTLDLKEAKALLSDLSS
jgi:predicted ATPase